MSADRYKTILKNELIDSIHNKSLTKEEVALLNLERHKQKLQMSKDAVIEVINRKDIQLSEHKQRIQ